MDYRARIAPVPTASDRHVRTGPRHPRDTRTSREIAVRACNELQTPGEGRISTYTVPVGTTYATARGVTQRRRGIRALSGSCLAASGVRRRDRRGAPHLPAAGTSGRV